MFPSAVGGTFKNEQKLTRTEVGESCFSRNPLSARHDPLTASLLPLSQEQTAGKETDTACDLGGNNLHAAAVLLAFRSAMCFWWFIDHQHWYGLRSWV